MRPHLTVEQRQLALRLKARGLTVREIGPQVDCSFQCAARAVRQASRRPVRHDGWVPGPGRLTLAGTVRSFSTAPGSRAGTAAGDGPVAGTVASAGGSRSGRSSCCCRSEAALAVKRLAGVFMPSDWCGRWVLYQQPARPEHEKQNRARMKCTHMASPAYTGDLRTEQAFQTTARYGTSRNCEYSLSARSRASGLRWTHSVRDRRWRGHQRSNVPG
jgi:hypothetical protein